MTERPRILVVEDETDVRDFILLHLKRESLEGVGCSSAEEALEVTKASKFNLAIVDWMLPGSSGLELCKQLTGSLPILMLTARSDVPDIVLGLASGADDFVTKPFDIPVFIARVHALLRRSRFVEIHSQAGTVEAEIYSSGGLVLNTAAHEVTCRGQKIDLTPTEFRLLASLMKNAGRVLSRDKLIGEVQGHDIYVGDRTVDTHVFGLRKKLGECAPVIETIRGVGYRVQGE